MTLAARIAAKPRAVRVGVALVGLALVLALAWAVIVGPLRALIVSQSQWRSEARAALAQARGTAAFEAPLREQLQQLPQQPLWQRLYAVEAPELASALQRDLSALSATAGASSQSMLTLPSVEERGLLRSGARLSVSLDARALQALLEGIRQHSRYLRIERLTLTAPQAQTVDQNPTLAVTLEVFGYAWPDSARAALTAVAEREGSGEPLHAGGDG